MPGARRVRSEGQSVDQPVHTLVSIGDSVQQGPSLVEGSSSIGPNQEDLVLGIEG